MGAGHLLQPPWEGQRAVRPAAAPRLAWTPQTSQHPGGDRREASKAFSPSPQLDWTLLTQTLCVGEGRGRGGPCRPLSRHPRRLGDQAAC